ncbi:MAG: YpfN family protein [Muribaculaceae bacterium]
MSQRIKTIFALIACMFMWAESFGKVTVTARLDSVNIQMGSMTMLGLEVVQDKGKPGGFPMFSNVDPALGYVGICGDSIELRTSYKADTVELGSGRIQINYKVPLQSFDSGTYRLPQFVYVSESDSARSNALTLNVVPLKVTANDPIAGFAPIAEPEGKKFFDFVPDWLADFWWVVLIVLLAIIAFIWAMRRYKKEGTVLKKKPQPSPYEVAMRDLTDLKAKKLWEQGMEKEYFTRLTDILRIYLDRRFGINAMEMTSREIMDHLYESDVKDKRDYIRQILNVADFVKFAKVRPLPADNIAAYDNAVRFVEETKPVETASPDSHDDANGDKTNTDTTASVSKESSPNSKIVNKQGKEGVG